MRQVLDKIFTYESCGTTFPRLLSPVDLINHAVITYVTRTAKIPKKIDDPELTAHTIADETAVALDQVHSTLKDITALTAVTSILFAGGNADFIWRDRVFVTTRSAFYSGLSIMQESSGTVPRSAQEFVGNAPTDLRRMLADVVLALLAESGIVEWPNDLCYSRTIERLAIPYYELPLVVAESMVRSAKIKPASQPSGTRVMFGKVFDYLREATLSYANHLNVVSTTVHYAGRIVDIAARSLRGSDPALPRAPFAPLATAVNFVAPGTASVSIDRKSVV